MAEARIKSSPWLTWTCLGAGLICVSFSHAPAFVLMQTVHMPNFAPYGPNLKTDRILLWHTVGAVFLVAGVIGSAGVSRILAHRIPVYLGRVSFAIYLLHFPLTFSLFFRAAEFGHVMGMYYVSYALLALIVLLAVLFPLAEAFYRLVDLPSVRLADWISGGWDKRAPALGLHKIIGETDAPTASGPTLINWRRLSGSTRRN